jgi:DNA-directed RNA polymerase subunit F
MEEQLQQERGACQQAETQLQQERTALAEAQTALKRERMAREEAQGLLQQERTALKKAQATLKLQDEEVTQLNEELAQLSVSYEDQHQTGEEKDATILDLQRGLRPRVRPSRRRRNRSRVCHLSCLSLVGLGSFGIRSQLGLCFDFQACGRLLGTQ